MGNLQNFAKDELTRAGAFNEGGMYGDLIGKAVMGLIDVFSGQGHSGMSASLAISLFEKVASFEPLTPLTGDDDEWTEVSEGLFQNRRCAHVFKQNGDAYDLDGRVFREPDGVCFTSRDSRVPVTFPYVPTREYVDVPARDNG